MTELTDAKLFIFLGLENFLEQDETSELIKFCQNHEIHVLCIDTSEKYKGDDGQYRKIIIDHDFCII